MVVVVGPSGVGKSSLVQAGLIPNLQQRHRWSTVLIRPGQDPWQRLAAGLLRAQHGQQWPLTLEDYQRVIGQLREEGFGPVARFLRSEGRPLLVVVDQFEELLADDQRPDRHLLDLLLPPDGETEDAVRLVMILRADFLRALQSIPGSHTRLNDRLYLMSPLTSAQMREAVQRPAQARGVAFEPRLADQIVSDAAEGSLPLLEFTLTKLWDTQRHKTLTHAGYHTMGGVRGALDRFAEDRAAQLRGTAAEVLDRILLRLVRTPIGGADLATRQRVLQSQASPAEWQVLRRLADARLVVLGTGPADGEPYAELVHETLITSWQRLRDLVAENAEFLGWLAWIQQRTADGDPLSEARIAEARRWLDTRPDDFPDAVRRFIENSETAAEARLRELRDARDRAEGAARKAEARRLAAAAELALASRGVSLQVPIALAIESLRMEPTIEGDTAARHVIGRAPIQRGGLDHGGVRAVAFGPDWIRVATVGADRSARVFDAATGAEVCRMDHDDKVIAVAFSPDGTRVATMTRDHGARVFDAATGAEVCRMDYDDKVIAVAFSPDGTRVATGGTNHGARVFDAATGAEVCRIDHGGPVGRVVFSPDGTRVATSSAHSVGRGGRVQLSDAHTGAESCRVDHDHPVYALAFSPDGTRVASGSGDYASPSGCLRVLDAATGAEVVRLDYGRTVYALAFSPDGTRVAAASSGIIGSYGWVRVIDAASGAEVCCVDHDGPVFAVAFSPDGTKVAAGSGNAPLHEGGCARVFDAVTGAELCRVDHDDKVHAVVFSPDATRVATTTDHGARVFDAVAGAELCRVDHDGPVYAVAFSPDGTRVATGSGRAGADWGCARVFDAVTGAELCRLDHDEQVNAVAFSSGGTRLATGSGHSFGHRGCARVFDVATGAELCHLDHDDQVNAVAFSPDGTPVATGGRAPFYRGCLRVFDVATGAEAFRLDHDDPVHAVAFGPREAHGLIGAAGTRERDGHVLVYDVATDDVKLFRFDDPVYAFTPDLARVATVHGTLRGDDHVRVFDTATGAELSRLDLDNEVNAVTFSPQGTCVAVATGGRFITRSGSARVFEVTGAELCRLDHDGPVNAVVFSPDGMRVATGSHDYSARVWIVDRAQLIEQALGRLTRNLTQHEWRQYFRDEPYT